MLDEFDHQQVRRRAANIVGSIGAGSRSPRPAQPPDVDAILRAIDFLLPRTKPEMLAEPLERVDPPRYTAPWYSPQPVDPMRGDPKFGLEDPEALRAAGSKQVATALAQMAEEGLMSWRKSTREIAALVLDWLDRDGGQFEDLLADVGFRVKRGPAFTQIKRQAERNAILQEICQLAHWGNQKPMAVAREIREQFEDYEINGGWETDRNSDDPPKGEMRAQFWHILKIGLHNALPNIQGLAAMVERSRN